MDFLSRIKTKKILFCALFFSFAAAVFARGVNDPSVSVITPPDAPQSRLITINWSTVQNPHQYEYILYRANRAERNFIPFRVVSAYDTRILDSDLPQRLSNYFYFVTHENAARLASGVKITDEEIEAQLRTIPGYTGSSSGGSILIQSDGSFPYGSYDSQLFSQGVPKQPAQRPLNDGISLSLLMFASNIVSQAPLIPLDPVGRLELLHILEESYKRRETIGTALYYAEHTVLAALSSLESAHALPSNLESINIITFTDGLDTSSTDISLKSPDANNFAGRQSLAYRNFISQQIKTRRIAGKKINAWSIGVPGRDVINGAEFQATLDAIASSPENVSYLNNISQVEAQLLQIADKLKISTTRSHLTFTTPAYSVGTNVRLTFDKSSYAADSLRYIEGRVSNTNGTYSLVGLRGEDIVLVSGPVATGKRTGAGIEYTVTIDGAYDDDIMQWYKATNVGSVEWQQNSETLLSKITDFTNSRKSAVVYFILDCSSSLNESEITRVRQAATMFIEKLYNIIGNPDQQSVGFQNSLRTPTQTIQPSWEESQTQRQIPSFEQMQPPPPSYGSYSTMQTAPTQPTRQSQPDSQTRSSDSARYTIAAQPNPNLRLPQKTVLFDAPYSGLWVQTGAYTELRFAQDLWRKLYSNGCNDAEIFSKEMNGTTYFRVKVGPYQDRSTAELARSTLINSGLGFDDCFIVRQ